jgi:hypothetical protein
LIESLETKEPTLLKPEPRSKDNELSETRNRPERKEEEEIKRIIKMNRRQTKSIKYNGEK